MSKCGPVYSTWFASGVWPTCKCGFSPRDNIRLREHWAAEGFEVVAVGQSLVRRRFADGAWDE